MVIVDSSVWIDFLNQRVTPQTSWLRAPQNIGTIGLTSLVFMEVLQGVRFDSRFRIAEQFFRTMPVFESLTRSLAIHAASNYRTLRGMGITIQSTIDCLIATFCIESSYQLLHSDSDFDYFEQHLHLSVLHPPAQRIP
ncbi:MAG: PIN domain nuclease [Terracidiphilus sp.]|jgi:predicted nucleic acid-binding protein